MPGERRAVAAQLHPAFAALQQREDPPHVGVVVRGVRRQSAHVIEDHGNGQRRKDREQVAPQVPRHVHLDVPAELRDLPGHTGQVFERRPAFHRRDETGAPDAARVQLAQLFLGHVRVHHGDAARPVKPQFLHRRRGAPVVGAEDACLHHDAALQAERIEHRQIVGNQGVGRGEAAVGRIGVPGFGPEDMHMAVAGQAGNGQRRPLRVLARRQALHGVHATAPRAAFAAIARAAAQPVALIDDHRECQASRATAPGWRALEAASRR